MKIECWKQYMRNKTYIVPYGDPRSLFVIRQLAFTSIFAWKKLNIEKGWV